MKQRFVAALAMLMVETGCATERIRASVAASCSKDEMVGVASRTTPSQQNQIDEADEANALGGIDYALLPLGIVLATLAHVPFTQWSGSGSHVERPAVGWPHIWYGCGNIALCQPNNTCGAAAWMSPSAVPKLMERSTKGPFVDLGISDCGDPAPSTRRTGPLTWELSVCGLKADCFVVSSSKEFECVHNEPRPVNAAPTPRQIQKAHER